MYAAKKLLEGQGSTLLEGRQTGLDLRRDQPRARSISTRRSPGIENADAVLLVGSNIRWEAPLIATRVRKVARKGGKVFAIGPEVDLGMKVEWLGDDLKLLGKLPKAVDGRVREGGAAGGDRRRRCACRGRARRGARAGRAARPDQGRLERLQRAALLGLAHGGR